MATEHNRGIDYSGALGTCNRNAETGIRYGILPVNNEQLCEWFWDSVESEYDQYCPHCGNELADDWENHEHCDHCEDADDNGDPHCPHCGEEIADGDQWSDEPSRQVLQGEETGFIDDSGDIWITESPYFTRAQFCSPCAPGACYIENHCTDGERAYCIGPRWFADGKAPYPVYRVDTGLPV